MPVKIKDLLYTLLCGGQPEIEFTDAILESVSSGAPDPGMRARLIAISENTDPFYRSDAPETVCYDIKVDLSPYEEHNRGVARRDYFDESRDGKLTWFETNNYPEDGIYEWPDYVRDGQIDFFTVTPEKERKLFMVRPIGDPSVYMLVYAANVEGVVLHCCEHSGIDPVSTEEFLAGFECEPVETICGKKIKAIIFEEDAGREAGQ